MDASGMSGLLPPPGVTQAQLDRALAECERIASRSRSSLYVTSQFFEDRSRYEAFIAMYAVMRVIDDRIDTIPNKVRLPAGQCAALDLELDCWDTRIGAAFKGRSSNDPLDVALGAAVRTFPVPAGLWSNFIDAMRFEIRHSRFSDFTEFLAYAEGATVAPAVIYVFLLSSLRD